MQQVKIQMFVTVDVDPVYWDEEYQCGSNAREVRADVINYVRGILGNAEAPMVVEVRDNP